VVELLLQTASHAAFVCIAELRARLASAAGTARSRNGPSTRKTARSQRHHSRNLRASHRRLRARAMSTRRPTRVWICRLHSD